MNQPKEKRSPRTTWLIVSGVILGVPLLLCGGLLTWYLSRQSAASEEMNRRIEDLSQRGEPVDDESLQLAYQIATSGETTDAWVAVGKTLDSEPYSLSARDMPFHGAVKDDDTPIVVPRPGQPWPDRANVDEFLATWQDQLNTVRQLGEQQYTAAKPVRRPIEFKSLNTLLPDTQRIRAMAKMLRLEHAVAVYDGDGQRGYQCIRACRGLERSTYGEPILISQLIGQAVGRIAGEMMQKSIEHGQLTNQQMDELAANMPTFADLHALYLLAMRGERAMVLPIFANPEQAREILEIDSDAGAKLMTTTRAVDAVFYLDMLDRYLSLPADDLHSFLQAASQAETALINDVADAGMLKKMDHAVSHMLLPGARIMAEVFVRRIEYDNLTKLAMAVRKFHRQFGSWPKSRAELSKINVDASKMTALNSPFGYRLEKQGDALLWGIDRSSGPSMVPSEPPDVADEDSPNAAWVWRLRP
jgi:hypothetical protein